MIIVVVSTGGTIFCCCVNCILLFISIIFTVDVRVDVVDVVVAVDVVAFIVVVILVGFLSCFRCFGRYWKRLLLVSRMTWLVNGW